MNLPPPDDLSENFAIVELSNEAVPDEYVESGKTLGYVRAYSDQEAMMKIKGFENHVNRRLGTGSFVLMQIDRLPTPKEKEKDQILIW